MHRIQDLVDRLLTALWQTIVFCGPMFFVFVAILIALVLATIYFEFRDEARHATSRKRTTEPNLSAGADRQPTPGEPVLFDQALLPAWTPTAPETEPERHRLLRYDRRQRAATQRSIA